MSLKRRNKEQCVDCYGTSHVQYTGNEIVSANAKRLSFLVKV